MKFAWLALSLCACGRFASSGVSSEPVTATKAADPVADAGTPGPAAEVDAGTAGAADAEGPDAGRPMIRDTGIIPESSPVVILAAGDISNSELSGNVKTAELVLANLDGVSAVLTLGDNQYWAGDAAGFANFFDKTWGRFKPLLRPVPGNHDYLTPNATGYFDYFGAAVRGPDKLGYYAYDVGDWRLYALNTNEKCTVVPCAAGSEQERWLRKDLSANPRRCVLAYWHHPRFSSGPHGNALFTQGLWQALYDARAEIILNGHEHTYERFAPMSPEGTPEPVLGVREFIVGTGGIGLYGFGPVQPNSEARQNTHLGVLKLTLSADRYSWEFLSVAGSPPFVDKGQGRCH